MSLILATRCRSPVFLLVYHPALWLFFTTRCRSTLWPLWLAINVGRIIVRQLVDVNHYDMNALNKRGIQNSKLNFTLFTTSTILFLFLFSSLFGISRGGYKFFDDYDQNAIYDVHSVSNTDCCNGSDKFIRKTYLLYLRLLFGSGLANYWNAISLPIICWPFYILFHLWLHKYNKEINSWKFQLYHVSLTHNTVLFVLSFVSKYKALKSTTWNHFWFSLAETL